MGVSPSRRRARINNSAAIRNIVSPTRKAIAMKEIAKTIQFSCPLTILESTEFYEATPGVVSRAEKADEENGKTHHGGRLNILSDLFVEKFIEQVRERINIGEALTTWNHSGCDQSTWFSCAH